MDRLFFGRDLDTLDLFEFLDPALNLLGLGCLVAEAVDEDFQLVDTVALVLVGSLHLLIALSLLRQELVVVAGVEPEALVPDFRDLIYRHVEEVAIMRNQQERVGIILQILFQPVASFEIEMVGGLIEQQQVRLLQQQFGEREAHLPATGELIRKALPVLFAEAQAH